MDVAEILKLLYSVVECFVFFVHLGLGEKMAQSRAPSYFRRHSQQALGGREGVNREVKVANRS